MNMKKNFYAVLVLSPILLLSGCNPIKWIMGDKTDQATGEAEKGKKGVTSDWIVKVGDEVVVTPEKFQEDFDALLDEKPQLKAMLPLMPNLEHDFARGLGNQQAILQFIKENGIDQSSEYIAKKERMINAIEQMLNAEFFAEAFPTAQLSDKQAEDFYEEHKDSIQGILISKGGVAVSGVSFDKKADADAFYNRVKGVKKLDLKKVAEENRLGEKFRDFNMVNGQSFGVDPVLKTKILALKEFPKVDVLAIGDKAFWVVHATEKQEAQYRPFAEVKDGVKNVAQQTVKAKQLQVELDKLTTEYGVEINEGYFQEKVARASAEAAVRAAVQEKKNEVAEAEAMSPLPASKTV